MTTCFIIRHAAKQRGEFFNAHLGHADEPISEAGLDQARALADFLAGRELAAVYISEYRRTAQTAAPLAERLGLMPVVDARLNEFDNGRLGSLTEAEVQVQFPEVWQGILDRAYDFRYPGGETGAEAAGRIAEFLDAARLNHPDGSVVAICHEGLIRLMMCQVMGLPVYRRGNFFVDFCGVTELCFQPEYGAWKLMRFNQVCSRPD